MKPLRTGLAAGLLAGAASAANKLLSDRRDGGLGSARVVTGLDEKAPAKGAITAAVGTVVARRAARKAEANRPPWVVATVPGTTVSASAPPRPAPAPVAARRLPSLESLKPPSAKTMGATVGKYAVKQAGKAIGKAAADRVGKAIEVIEVLEKVVASATSESTKPAPTPTGPGAAVRPLPATANLVSTPVRPGPADVPSTASTPTEAVPVATPPAEPRGTLVSVRKFERGPRVVVGKGVKPADPEPKTEAAVTAAEAPTVTAAEPVDKAPVVTAEAAVPTAAEPVAEAPAAAKEAPVPKPKAPAKKASTKRAPAKAKAKAAAPATDAAPPSTNGDGPA